MSHIEREQAIIGTAGHIDHGKTTLVKALTGVDCDALAEEKRRGITIELGFAFMETPDFDKQIVFIDVPGHEKLIKTMVAGASNIDAALLVVAADEGVNVQTLEHFDILQLLGIEAGVIGLTKCDLVDDQHLQLIEQEVKEMVAGTFLADAPIIPVSAVTGKGVPEIRSALLDAASKVKARRDSGIFRMPIDRVFTMQGFGAVVAGTVLSGQVHIGDKLEVLPEGLQTRVRGVQVHSESAQTSGIGKRTAVNLQDVKKDQLRRGQTLCAAGSMKTTLRLDARLSLLRGFDEELKNRTRVRLHVGTDEVICRVVLLDSDKLTAGQTGLVQFVLEAPTVALPKDRFVIRTFSSLKTVGGGTILDSQPRHRKRFDDAALGALDRMEGGVSDVVEQAFAKAKFMPKTLGEMTNSLGESENNVSQATDELVADGRLVRVGRDKYLHIESYNDLIERFEAIIRAYYSREPYKLLMPSADLQSRFFKLADKQVYDTILSDLCDKNRLRKRDNKIGLTDYTPPMSDVEKKALDQVEHIYQAAAFSTPLEEDVQAEVRLNPKSFQNVMNILIDQGRLVRLSDKVTYQKDYADQARQIVIDHIASKGGITAAELRDILDVTRKYSIAVLEYLDSIFVTRRDGDRRVLR